MKATVEADGLKIQIDHVKKQMVYVDPGSLLLLVEMPI